MAEELDNIDDNQTGGDTGGDDKVKVLHEAVSKKYDVGTLDDFRKKLQDPAKRKAFYEGVGKEYELGTFDEFETKLGVKKKDAGPSGSSDLKVKNVPSLGSGGAGSIKTADQLVGKKEEEPVSHIDTVKGAIDRLNAIDLNPVKDEILQNDLKKAQQQKKLSQISQFATDINNPAATMANLRYGNGNFSAPLDQKTEDFIKTDVKTDDRYALYKYAQKHPEKANKIKADQYLVDSSGRSDAETNPKKVVDNAKKIESGEYDYSIWRGGPVQKPEGLVDALVTGHNQRKKEIDDFESFNKMNDDEKIKALEEERNSFNPDDPVPVPKGLAGEFGSMIGSNGVPMLKAAALNLGIKATDEFTLGATEGATPWLTAALLTPEYTARGYITSLKSNYAYWRDKGLSEKEAYEKADTQATIDAAKAGAQGALQTFAGAKIGNSSPVFSSQVQGLIKKSIGAAKDFAKTAAPNAIAAGGLEAAGNVAANINGHDRNVLDNVFETAGNQLMFDLGMGVIHKALNKASNIGKRDLRRVTNEVAKAPQETIDASLANMVIDGNLSQSDADAVRDHIKNTKEIDDLILDKVKNPEVRIDIQKQIEKRNALQDQIENSDVAYHPELKEKVKAINEKINELSSSKEARQGDTEDDNVNNGAGESAPSPTDKLVNFGETFKTKNHEVVYQDGKRVAIDTRTGEEVPEFVGNKRNRKWREIMKKQEENFNYNSGEKAPESDTQFTNQKDVAEHFINTSNNPSEIADVYVSLDKEPLPMNSVEQAIAQHGVGKIKTNSFYEVDDRNNVTNAMSRSYLVGENNKDGQTLDQVAQSISEHSGIDVSPEDVANYMKRFRNGEDPTKLRETDLHQAAKEKFEKLTGIPLNDRTAALAIEQLHTPKEVQQFGKQSTEQFEEMPDHEKLKWFQEIDNSRNFSTYEIPTGIQGGGDEIAKNSGVSEKPTGTHAGVDVGSDVQPSDGSEHGENTQDVDQGNEPTGRTHEQLAKDFDDFYNKPYDSLKNRQQQPIKVGDKKNTVEQYTQKAKAVLDGLFPDHKLVTYDSENDYIETEQRPKGSAGVFNPNTKIIALNLEGIRRNGAENTVFHEVIHPIVREALQSRPEAVNNAYSKLVELKDEKGMEAVWNHEELYRDRGLDTMKVEAITEFLTQVADGRIDPSILDKKLSTKIIDVINKILKALGINKQIATPTDLKVLAESIKQSFDEADATPVAKVLGKTSDISPGDEMDHLGAGANKKAAEWAAKQIRRGEDAQKIKDVLKDKLKLNDNEAEDIFNSGEDMLHANTAKKFIEEGHTDQNIMEYLKRKGVPDGRALAILGDAKANPIDPAVKESQLKDVKEVYFGKEDQFLGNKELGKVESAQEARNYQDKIKQSVKEDKSQDKYSWREVDDAIHLYNDIRGLSKQEIEDYQKKIDPSTHKRELKILNLSQNLNDKQKAIADEMKTEYEKVGNMALTEGLINEMKENYVARAWDIKGKSPSEVAAKFKTSTKHSLQRTLGSILQGYAEGMHLKINGASNNLATLKVELNNVIENRRLLNEGLKLKTKDGDPLFSTNPLNDYVKIESPAFKKWEYAGKIDDYSTDEQQVLGKRKDIVIGADGGVMKKSDVYAPADVAKSLNNILKVNKPGAIQVFNQAVKQSILSFSGFHYLAFSRAHVLSGLKMGEINPVTAYRAGLRMIAERGDSFKDLVRGGLTIGRQQDYVEGINETSTKLGQMLDKFEFTKSAKDKMLHLNESFHKHLFGTYGAGLKAFDAVRMYENELAKNPNADKKAVAERVSKLMNDTYGGINWQRMRGSFMQDPSKRSMVSLLLLAPDWCVDTKTRAMTKTGWKYYNELSIGEEILIFDPTTNKNRWGKINDQYINEDYAGRMISIKNHNREILMTPSHTCYVKNSTTGKYEIVKADNLQTNHLIPRCAEFETPTTEIYDDNFIKVVGWVVTDGYFKTGKWKRVDDTIGVCKTAKITQSKPEMVEVIKQFGFNYHIDNSMKSHDKFISNYPKCVFGVGSEINKQLLEAKIDNGLTWEFLSKLSTRQLRLLRDTMMLGDGTGQNRFCGKEKEVFYMTMIQTMLGEATTFYQQEQNCWRTRIVRTKHISCWGHHNNKSEVYYEGGIWCPSVDTGFWVAEKEGMIFITGNTASNLRFAKKAFERGEEGMLYRKAWARVILRGVIATTIANAMMATADDDDEDKKLTWEEKFTKRYKQAWDNGRLRGSMIDISPLYHFIGGDKEKKAYLSVFGAYTDPLKMVADPLSFGESKFSFVAKGGLEALTSQNWQHKEFTTLDELLGMDDKGTYSKDQHAHKAGEINPATGNPYVRTQTEHKAGDEKGGKLQGKLTKYPEGGAHPVTPGQLPSFALSQIRGMMPTAIQNIWQVSAGENDMTTGLLNAVGSTVLTNKQVKKDKK